MGYIDSIVDWHYETLMELEGKLKKAETDEEKKDIQETIDKEKRDFDRWNQELAEQ